VSAKRKPCECRICQRVPVLQRIRAKCNDEENDIIAEFVSAEEHLSVDLMYEKGIIGGENWGLSNAHLRRKLFWRYVNRMSLPFLLGTIIGMTATLCFLATWKP